MELPTILKQDTFPESLGYKCTPSQIADLLQEYLTTDTTITAALKRHGIAHQTWYGLRNRFPEIMTVYQLCKQEKAFIMAERAKELYDIDSSEDLPDYMVTTNKDGSRKTDMAGVALHRDKYNSRMRHAAILESGRVDNNNKDITINAQINAQQIAVDINGVMAAPIDSLKDASWGSDADG